jgi:hypothetical protein
MALASYRESPHREATPNPTTETARTSLLLNRSRSTCHIMLRASLCYSSRPYAASGSHLPIRRYAEGKTVAERLQQKKAQALEGGGKDRVQKQHEKGKLTARERVHLLLDKGSFREYDQLVTHRCTDFGMEKEKVIFIACSIVACPFLSGTWRRCGLRSGPYQWSSCICIFSRLHRLRRQFVRILCAKDLQGSECVHNMISIFKIYIITMLMALLLCFYLLS